MAFLKSPGSTGFSRCTIAPRGPSGFRTVARDTSKELEEQQSERGGKRTCTALSFASFREGQLSGFNGHSLACRGTSRTLFPIVQIPVDSTVVDVAPDESTVVAEDNGFKKREDVEGDNYEQKNGGPMRDFWWAPPPGISNRDFIWDSQHDMANL